MARCPPGWHGAATREAAAGRRHEVRSSVVALENLGRFDVSMIFQ
jgi:hypothetical protein